MGFGPFAGFLGHAALAYGNRLTALKEYSKKAKGEKKDKSREPGTCEWCECDR